MTKLKLKKIPKKQAEELVTIRPDTSRAHGLEQTDGVFDDRLIQLARGFALWGIPVIILTHKAGDWLAVPRDKEAEIVKIFAVYNELLSRQGEGGVAWKKQETYIGWDVVIHEYPSKKAGSSDLSSCRKNQSDLAITDLEAAKAFGCFLQNLPPYFDWNEPF